ncbi:hypothetical protein GCG54_00000597 [Colletotrichum gloeosporioides]|uniref:Heterokaryon incompatibility domain-containing protein n=1 Tax=Colletotrichum gloeosporioides TaxID=474922 RepID=A0A8H4CI94_COLGL|nr:uncharacterized protein GCG54_00000597 [Colletotrichum gloeosporioides]KAF3804247.1 hypothetical protein GCG54_00000597 [Colletotrichum gloeosporioides]
MTRIDADIQIGYPDLFEAGSQAYFEIIRHWLDTCDVQHRNCQRNISRNTSDCENPNVALRRDYLPTRVIAVGKPGDKTVHLLETRQSKPQDRGEWIALSHQWGNGSQFCTTTANLKAHIDGMDFELLPATFKHAVTVTRALGRPYLWIDSICIIQGEGGDFNQEAKNMEQVYSGAYCVLASSRSPGHYAGFLQKRNQRHTVVMRQHGKPAPFHISEIIDNFGSHVLDGSLNKRGWVLQEHALARRTVYFTDHQTYFECGEGVRCETMTKMTNELATFLGDPDFPKVIMKADQGERILRYQDLYSTYSRLGLSKDHDRTMAIDGLQDRLLNTLRVQGGFGIFDEGDKDGQNRGLLRRSLLWRRGAGTPTLDRIKFPKDHPIAKVPSWSWMACKGGIDYISPSFGGVDWEKMRSPWSKATGGFESKIQTDDRGGDVALVAEARDYNLLNLRDGQGEIIFDRPGDSHQPSTKCVVLGKQKAIAPLGDNTNNMRDHYLLIVASTNKRDKDGHLIYERVGAGYLPGKFIGSTGEEVRIH